MKEVDAIRQQLRDLRKTSGISQKQLAEKLCVAHQMVGGAEIGVRAVGLTFLAKWANALGMDLRLELRRRR